jgi:hypothetical protein
MTLLRISSWLEIIKWVIINMMILVLPLRLPLPPSFHYAILFPTYKHAHCLLFPLFFLFLFLPIFHSLSLSFHLFLLSAPIMLLAQYKPHFPKTLISEQLYQMNIISQHLPACH